MSAPHPFRLILTAEQSAAIRESGIGFVVGSPCSMRVVTAPATLLLFECTKETGDAACGVAMGTHRAVKKPTPPSP